MIPLLLVLALLGAWRWSSKRPGTWTPELHALYAYLSRVEKRGEVLLAGAKHFASRGFPKEAEALKNRVAVPEAHGEGRSVRADVFRRALRSRRPDGVRGVASEFEQMGCGASAEQLRQYARGLEVLREVRSQPGFGLGVVIPSQYPVPAPPPPPEAQPDPSAIPDDPTQGGS